MIGLEGQTRMRRILPCVDMYNQPRQISYFTFNIKTGYVGMSYRSDSTRLDVAYVSEIHILDMTDVGSTRAQVVSQRFDIE